jgi:hypothetical protein
LKEYRKKQEEKNNLDKRKKYDETGKKGAFRV